MDGTGIMSLLLCSVGQSNQTSQASGGGEIKSDISWEEVQKAAPTLIHYRDLGT